DSMRHRSASRRRRSCRASSALPEQLIERRAPLLPRLLVDRFDKVLVELAYDRVQPAPILRHGLEDDSAAAAPDADFLALESKILGKAYRLRSSRPEQLCPFHRDVLMSYTNSM